MYEINIQLPFNGYHTEGKLCLPVKAQSLILFSHGYGRSSLMPHEQHLALKFQQEGFGTLIFDTLDVHKDIPHNKKGLKLLTQGLLTSTQWLHSHSEYESLDLAFLGSGTGAATALKAASELPSSVVKAIVSLGGQLDLVKTSLNKISCATLLIAGELDFRTLEINKQALDRLKTPKQLAIIPGASHLFDEPDKLNTASNISVSWFKKWLKQSQKPKPC